MTGAPFRVLAVKGSGGDLGTMGRGGFAVLDFIGSIEEGRRLVAASFRPVRHEPRA